MQNTADAPAAVAITAAISARFVYLTFMDLSFTGLYLSIPISDQGDPSDAARSLSNVTNCNAAVRNLAVYSIDSEDDNEADAAGACMPDLVDVSGTLLCSCKFLIPHFSAFAVVDTSGSTVSPPPSTQSCAPGIALSVAALFAVALFM